MINMETLFKNHFNTNKISDDNMQKFSEIHLQRMSANNGGGEFTQMITDTTTAYTGYFGAITDEDTKFAVQQGLTVAMNNKMKAFQDWVSKKAVHLVMATYGKDSPEYQEFFPLGPSEYSQAGLNNIEVLLERMVTAANAHVADLGIPFVTDAQNYKNDFIAARESQLSKMGEVKDSKVDSSTTRDALENELMKNVFLIGSMYVGDIHRCMVFFDQSFVRDGSNVSGDEEPQPPTP
ncbi:MAG: hypothetical protein OQK64_05765 [Ignavibacteriaceae bacterium]|nr:hypothetical protein [Ignavibacteriaceae bacterium]